VNCPRIKFLNKIFLRQDNARREDTLGATTETGRPHREQPHDWQLDKALKRTHNASMRNLLSDNDHHSEQEKSRQLVEDNRIQAEKPKAAADARKRPGRPRKSVKSPKRGHRTSDENPKNNKSRNRTRTITTSGKKKQPISKATVATSDDDSDSRSQASSGSDSDRRSTVAATTVPPISEKRKSVLSASSSDEESLSPNKKNGNNASEDDATRWRRNVAIKRNKLSDSPKKQDKKKNSSKAKSRRSRGNNVSGDSDSDLTDLEVAIRNNRIQVAR